VRVWKITSLIGASPPAVNRHFVGDVGDHGSRADDAVVRRPLGTRRSLSEPIQPPLLGNPRAADQPSQALITVPFLLFPIRSSSWRPRFPWPCLALSTVPRAHYSGPRSH